MKPIPVGGPITYLADITVVRQTGGGSFLLLLQVVASLFLGSCLLSLRLLLRLDLLLASSHDWEQNFAHLKI